MATQPQMRRWRDAVEDALTAQQKFDGYERRQWELTRGKSRANDGPRPLEFDASGFPIPQPRPRFAQRIGRLVNGS
jgi:hypothetical protein